MLKKTANLSFWLGTSLYFGGLVTLGAIAAPGIFYVTTHNPITMPAIPPSLDMGRQVGGEIFGEVINRFVWIEVIGTVLLLFGTLVPLVAHRPVRRTTSLMFSLWMALAVLTAYDGFYVRPQVWEARTVLRNSALSHPSTTQTATAPATDAAPWPERERFDSLHTSSELLGRLKSYVLLAMILLGAVPGLPESTTGTKSKASEAKV